MNYIKLMSSILVSILSFSLLSTNVHASTTVNAPTESTYTIPVVSRNLSISPTALDGKTNKRQLLTSAHTTGEATIRVSVLITYTEYVDPSGKYVSSIESVYVYGGDYSFASFTMSNGYPKYQGIGTSTTKITCHGQLNYVSKDIPYNHKVYITLDLKAGTGTLV